MEITSLFGDRLGELLFDKNYTPDSLAKAIGIDASVIRRYLRKETIPTLKNAIILADFFACSLDFLLGLSDCGENVMHRDSVPFSECFKAILKEKNCSRYRLCKEANISDQRADDWYHGTRVPTVESVVGLAEFFDCTIDYLVGRTN